MRRALHWRGSPRCLALDQERSANLIESRWGFWSSNSAARVLTMLKLPFQRDLLRLYLIPNGKGSHDGSGLVALSIPSISGLGDHSVLPKPKTPKCLHLLLLQLGVMYIYIYIHMCIYIYIYLSIYLSFYLSIYLSVVRVCLWQCV